jgi:hypothetical protein
MVLTSQLRPGPRGRRYNAGADTEEASMASEAPIKQAVAWIDDRLRDEPGADRLRLVDDAARRFDLSPLDTDFLMRHLAERGKRA